MLTRPRPAMDSSIRFFEQSSIILLLFDMSNDDH
jgi:hypothetical protein